MLPLAGLAIGALAGLAKSGLDAKGRAADQQRNAAIMRYSPWTNMKPGEDRHVDTVGNVAKFGMAGAQTQQDNAAPDAGATSATANVNGGVNTLPTTSKWASAMQKMKLLDKDDSYSTWGKAMDKGFSSPTQDSKYHLFD